MRVSKAWDIFIGLCCLAALLGGVCSTAFAGQSACKTIVYSTNPQYPPYDWSEEGDAFVGASIELLELASPDGVALKPVVLPWKRAMQEARLGRIDLLVSLRITPERSRYLRFTSHRAFPNPIVVFVREDRQFPYAGFADLKGRLGGVSLGDTFGGGFDEYLRDHLRYDVAPSMQENFRKLDAGRIDYFVTSLYVGQAYSLAHPLQHTVVALSPPISEQDIHFGFSRLSPCAAFCEPMSEKLRELDEKGVPAKLIEKYLTRIRENAPAKP